MLLATGDPLARAVTAAIRTGNVEELRRLLAAQPGLATARIGGADMSRSLLHVVADWPGRVPCGAESVRALVVAGAEVDARFHGPHTETPLHWAASNDDVAVVDALLDAGADIEATGAVIGGGTPLTDARAFGQWKAAFRLVERGAQVSVDDAASLGLIDRVRDFLGTAPSDDDVSRLLWCACQGSRLDVARLLLDGGATIDWIPDWERLTPLDAAAREGASELVQLLRSHGALTAAELDGC